MALTAPVNFDTEGLRAQVRAEYDRVARDPGGEFHFNRGPEYAQIFLGYDPEALAALPAESTSRFAGVGNPLRRSAVLRLVLLEEPTRIVEFLVDADRATQYVEDRNRDCDDENRQEPDVELTPQELVPDDLARHRRTSPARSPSYAELDPGSPSSSRAIT